MNRLNPKHIILLIKRIVVEFSAFIFFMNQTSKMKKSMFLKRLNLIRGSWGKLIWVINLPPELLMSVKNSEEDLLNNEKSYVASASRELNSLLGEMRILDLIKIKKERIKTEKYYAYKLDISFNFVTLNIWNILYVISYLTGLFFLGIYAYEHIKFLFI